LSDFYAAVIAWSAKMLGRSDYGRKTFFRRDGHPKRGGDILRQPEVASFLTRVQRDGSDYMYCGEWATACVAAVQDRGGRMTLEDLRRWRPVWHEPWRISYGGHDVYAPAGRQYGGIWVGLALLALEEAHLGTGEHFSRDADALEVIVRTARETWAERAWFENPDRLDDRDFIASRLTPSYARTIAERVRKRRSAAAGARAGSHSYHVITADDAGSAVTGTNTIQSLPWGTGTFVQGIPLNLTALLPSRCRPGERIVNSMTMHVGLRDGVFQFATGAFTNSLLEANLQFLVNLLEYGLPADRVTALPRFGTFPHSLSGKIDRGSNWLDPEIDPAIVRSLRRRGVRLRQNGPLVGTGLDVGLGAVVSRGANGKLAGSLAPWPGLNAKWRREALPVKSRR
jgi:gamma-glutamyltranspeptidase/glutathione hydrolase